MDYQILDIFKRIMKSIFLSTFIGLQSESAAQLPPKYGSLPTATRRFSQWKELMTIYNSAFTWEIYKFGMYGCNCNFLGSDRPLSQAGYGPAIDEIDGLCKTYKTCLKCVEDTFGPQCYAEKIRYEYADDGEDGAYCTNREGSCARALCECDHEFAFQHNSRKDTYNSNFSHYYGGFNAAVCRKL